MEFLGIDAGGTKISACLYSEKFELKAKVLVPTPKNGNSLLAAIEKAAKLCGGKPSAIGISIAGPVDPKTGVVALAPNISGTKNLQLKKILQKTLGLLVAVDNDAKCFAIAEQALGAGKGLENAVFLAIGTGIGGAIVSNGMLCRGQNNSAGEFGHIRVQEKGIKCGCGGRGCLEQYASGTAIERMAKSVGKDWSAKEVFERAASGNPAAKRIVSCAGASLGIGIASIANALNPSAIIIGGSVSKSLGALMLFVKKELKTALPTARVVKILASKLENAQSIGAALNAKKLLAGKSK